MSEKPLTSRLRIISWYISYRGAIRPWEWAHAIWFHQVVLITSVHETSERNWAGSEGGQRRRSELAPLALRQPQEDDEAESLLFLVEGFLHRQEVPALWLLNAEGLQHAHAHNVHAPRQEGETWCFTRLEDELLKYGRWLLTNIPHPYDVCMQHLQLPLRHCSNCKMNLYKWEHGFVCSAKCIMFNGSQMMVGLFF